MAIFQLGAHRPLLHPSVWVADSAELIGQVELGEDCSVWFKAVLRGDNDRIVIGRGSNIQDGAVLHTDEGIALHIGQDVLVGHQCMLHGCTIGDGALIGIQAVVMNGARIGRNCLVGAGALVTEGQQFDDGSLIIGTPARAVRTMDAAQIERMRGGARRYVELARRYARELQRID